MFIVGSLHQDAQLSREGLVDRASKLEIPSQILDANAVMQCRICMISLSFLCIHLPC